MMVVSNLFVSQSLRSMDPVSLKDLRNIALLLVLGLLYKVGWALVDESADLHYHPFRRLVCRA